MRCLEAWRDSKVSIPRVEVNVNDYMAASFDNILYVWNGSGNKIQPSALEAVRENSRQFAAAIEKAGQQKAAEIHFQDITGRTIKRYFDGSKYSERKSAMYENYGGKDKRKGVYKVKFKKPKNWK